MPPHAITAKTRLLAVCGWPVAHSLSPAIHNAALRAAGLDYVYVALPIDPARFAEALRGLAASGLAGLNCTVPHKFAALALCDVVSEEARRVGAVNTIHFRAEGLYGANTDVEGYVETLRRDAGFDLEGARVVQFGAGGAGRGMALGALQAGARRLTLVNRSAQKAERIAADFAPLFPAARIEALAAADAGAVGARLAEATLTANATSLGLAPGDPMPCAPEAIASESLVFDAAYAAEGATAWLRAAREDGRRTLDGLGMLVRQGAAAFRVWTGVEPDLKAMFGALPRGASFFEKGDVYAGNPSD